MGNAKSSPSSLPSLQHVQHCETLKFMGTWFVIGVKPTMFETTCSNAVEQYSFINSEEQKNCSHDINIDFQYNSIEPILSPIKSLPQKGWVQGDNKLDSGLWKVSPFWPIKMPYLILEVDEKNYEHCVIGYPNREYCWILSRKPKLDDNTYNDLIKKLKEKHLYDLTTLRKVPQYWTADERKKRGLSEKEIPNEYLEKE